MFADDEKRGIAFRSWQSRCSAKKCAFHLAGYVMVFAGVVIALRKASAVK